MKIEILYPEICCLYGDKANMMYLQKCLPEATFVETSLTDEPAFVREEVDLIYLCSMSEKNQELLIDILAPYKKRIQELMEARQTLFLLIGNSLEIFGAYIQREDETKKDALGLFDLYTVRQCPKRFNSLILAEFMDTKIVGYTSRFSHSYMDNSDCYLFKVKKGAGLNPNSKFEGIHFDNVYATYLLGPLLIANPDFTKHLLRMLGAETGELPFEKELYQAYHQKLATIQKHRIRLG